MERLTAYTGSTAGESYLQDAGLDSSYKLLFQQHPTAMWIYGINTLRILEANEACCKLYGYTRQELVERSLVDLRLKEDVPDFLEKIEQLKRQATSTCITRHIRKNGEPLFVETVGQSIIFQGQPCRLVTITDVTSRIEGEKAQAELRSAKERFDIMLRATNDLIWDWNLLTNKVYRDEHGVWNVYGVNDALAIDSFQSWLNHIHPEDLEAVSNTISNIVLGSLQEDNFELEYRFRRDDGTYSYVYDRGMILRDEHKAPIRMIGAAQDISVRKMLEKEIIQNELDYQKEIHQAMVQTQEKERAEIGKELHDNVNQMLTTTKLYLELTKTNKEIQEELLEKSIKNILTVINEIRQLSRSLMNPSLGDLGLVDSINDLIENINITRKLRVTLHAFETIEGLLDKPQKLMIFRIIQEVLNNAVKHSMAASIQIIISHDQKQGEVIIVDDGIGFNVETVKKGAGLKNIENRIYLMNGNYSIQSIPNKGSKFIINFPLSEGPFNN